MKYVRLKQICMNKTKQNFNGSVIKEGWGGNGRAIKEKRIFFNFIFPTAEVPTTLKFETGVV